MRCVTCNRIKEDWDRGFKKCWSCRRNNRRYREKQIRLGLCSRGDKKKIFGGGYCKEHYEDYAERRDKNRLENIEQHRANSSDYYHKQKRYGIVSRG